MAISGISLALTLKSDFERKRAESYLALIEQSQSQEQLLAADPSLLTLHGIDLQHAQKIGIDPAQIVYVLVDLRQDQMFYKLYGLQPELTAYRKRTLADDEFRTIYKD